MRQPPQSCHLHKGCDHSVTELQLTRALCVPGSGRRRAQAAEACADLDASGEVEVADLLLLLAAYGQHADVRSCPFVAARLADRPPAPWYSTAAVGPRLISRGGGQGDVNGSGSTDVADLLIVLSLWGQASCPPGGGASGGAQPCSLAGMTAQSTSGRAINVIPGIPALGDHPFTDRAYTFENMGTFADRPNTYYVQPAQDDKDTPADSVMWTLNVPVPVTVYLDFWGGDHHVNNLRVGNDWLPIRRGELLSFWGGNLGSLLSLRPALRQAQPSCYMRDEARCVGGVFRSYGLANFRSPPRSSP